MYTSEADQSFRAELIILCGVIAFADFREYFAVQGAFVFADSCVNHCSLSKFEGVFATGRNKRVQKLKISSFQNANGMDDGS